MYLYLYCCNAKHTTSLYNREETCVKQSCVLFHNLPDVFPKHIDPCFMGYSCDHRKSFLGELRTLKLLYCRLQRCIYENTERA